MRSLLLVAALFLAVTPLSANSLVSNGSSNQIGKSGLRAEAVGDWNRLKFKEGKNVEVWTLDGPLLNRVVFFGGIEPGSALVKEEDKKKSPLPKFLENMLLTDIPELLESTYRTQGRVSKIEILSQEPAKISGTSAIRFTYNFVRSEDEVSRRGEAVGAVKNKKLYLVVYEAPALHFFEKDVDRYRELVSTLSF